MPVQVKIFHDSGGSMDQFQKTINDWLAELSNLKIHHITQSQVRYGDLSGPMPITICIWYSEQKYE